MTPGFEYALAAMIFLGLVDLVYKRGAAAGVQAHQFLMVQAWCFAPAVTLFGLITGTLAPEAAMLWGMGAGLFVFVALYNFARSLKRGSVSTVAPIFRLSFTVTALLAVLVLGEPMTPYKLMGLALALAAVWLLLGAEAGAASAAGTARLTLVLLFESLERGEASVLVPNSQMGFVVTAAFGLALLGEPFTLRKGAGLAVAVGALACLANS